MPIGSRSRDAAPVGLVIDDYPITWVCLAPELRAAAVSTRAWCTADWLNPPLPRQYEAQCEWFACGHAGLRDIGGVGLKKLHAWCLVSLSSRHRLSLLFLDTVTCKTWRSRWQAACITCHLLARWGKPNLSKKQRNNPASQGRPHMSCATRPPNRAPTVKLPPHRGGK